MLTYWTPLSPIEALEVRLGHLDARCTFLRNANDAHRTLRPHRTRTRHTSTFSCSMPTSPTRWCASTLSPSFARYCCCLAAHPRQLFSEAEINACTRVYSSRWTSCRPIFPSSHRSSNTNPTTIQVPHTHHRTRTCTFSRSAVSSLVAFSTGAFPVGCCLPASTDDRPLLFLASSGRAASMRLLSCVVFVPCAACVCRVVCVA